MGEIDYNELILDPLSGCLTEFRNMANKENFLSLIKEELVKYSNEAKADAIVHVVQKDLLKMQKLGIADIETEYFINELLYELRILKDEHDEDFEEVVTNNWCVKIEKRAGYELEYDFLDLLIVSRGKRKR